VRPKQSWVQPDATDPVGNEARILSRGYAALGATTTSEQEFAGPFVVRLQIIIDGLAGLLAQFKSNGPAGFLLSDRCSIRRVPAGGNILDPDGDNVTASQLAVDRQIEHSEVASATFDLEFRPD